MMCVWEVKQCQALASAFMLQLELYLLTIRIIGGHGALLDTKTVHAAAVRALHIKRNCGLVLQSLSQAGLLYMRRTVDTRTM